MTASGGNCPLRRRLRTKTAASSCLGGLQRSLPLQALTPQPSTQASSSRYEIKERHRDYLVLKSALSSSQIQMLNEFLKRKRPRPAKMKNEGAGDSDDERKARYDDRDSRVCWFNAQVECPWLHDLLVDMMKDVGNVEWPLTKVGASGHPIFEYEDTQYTVYGPKQHFQAWHQDAFAEGNDAEDARQFTVVLMLTERSAYTGGHFQAKLPKPGSKKKVIRNISLDLGDALIFPAKRLMHRVTAVETGIRKTIVFWAWDKTSSRYHTGRAGSSK